MALLQCQKLVWRMRSAYAMCVGRFEEIFIQLQGKTVAIVGVDGSTPFGKIQFRFRTKNSRADQNEQTSQSHGQQLNDLKVAQFLSR